MNTEDDVDIAGSLGLVSNEYDLSDESDQSFSDSGDVEVQDEVEFSDDEADSKLKNNKSKVAGNSNTFPSLELTDDEEDKDLLESSFFINNNTPGKKAKAGTFMSFGFSKFLLKNIARKGYKQPTPIQRKTIPLIMESRDVVGMARTGSGKTAAFTLPLIDKLKSHSPRAGARAVILSPSRELALQTFKQVKEFSKGTDLRSIVLIGGDSLEDQFSSMMGNPDIIVATPGRFLHLKVEMELDLKTVEYIVFDEADRLFEMGFSEQLNELIASLPSSRQSLLFSATLPRSLIDFAKAGLSNPVLVRLDTESKISDDLQMAYFTTKKNEREANLLCILQEVINMPLASEEEIRNFQKQSKIDDSSDNEDDSKTDKSMRNKKKKFKREVKPSNMLPSPHSTIVFVPTKHHVEYISMLLKDAGYLVSYIYGSLDMHARKQQLHYFRSGITPILVVTDVAARGIDIPVLANVINFTLPASSKIFIHRVGRTARAGNKGWAYTIVGEKELPYLLDLELFLGKKVLLTSMHERKCDLLKEKQGQSYIEPKISYCNRLVLGSIPRSKLGIYQDLFESVYKNHYELRILKDVATRGEKLYHRTRQSASQESVKRSKEILEIEHWDDQHLLFGPNLEKEKENFLAKLANRSSKETVFEFLKKGKDKDDDSLVEFMNKRRKQIAPIQRRAKERRELLEKERLAGLHHGMAEELLHNDDEVGYSVAPIEADENELRETFDDAERPKGNILGKKQTYKDPQFFLSHYAPASDIQDKQLSISKSFANDAATASFDLENDDKMQVNKQVIKWDKKKGKYINSKSSDNVKYIIGENGQRMPASLKSGRYEEWRKKRKFIGIPTDLGTREQDTQSSARFKHKKIKLPKLPDKYRNDYEKQKKKVEKAVEAGHTIKGYHKPGQNPELKSTEEIRKARLLKEKRRAKNARPSKKSKK